MVDQLTSNIDIKIKADEDMIYDSNEDIKMEYDERV